MGLNSIIDLIINGTCEKPAGYHNYNTWPFDSFSTSLWYKDSFECRAKAKERSIGILVHTNVTYCTRQSLTIDWNQFSCCCSVRVRPSKESSVWVASSSSLAGTTTGSGCDYWQTTSHISTAPGSNASVTERAINTPFAAHFHQWAKVSVWAQFIFAPCFCLLHLGLWCSCHTVDVGRDLGEGFEKAHWVLFKLRITQTVGSLLHLSVYSVTQARTHYIHIWDTSHKQTWATLTLTHTHTHTHTPQPRKQHMHKSGSGATTERCCFNGSDLLLLRPVWKSWAAASAAASSHWMNPVPWQSVTWSSGLWATACLPACLTACPAVSGAFNHSSFWLQLWGPPHSMQISVMQQQRCHTPSLSLGHGGLSHVFTAGSRKSGRHHHTTSFITDR